MLVLNIKIGLLYYFGAAALEEGIEEWETKAMRSEGAWEAKRKRRKGEGKVASPHQRKFFVDP